MSRIRGWRRHARGMGLHPSCDGGGGSSGGGSSGSIPIMHPRLHLSMRLQSLGVCLHLGMCLRLCMRLRLNVSGLHVGSGLHAGAVQARSVMVMRMEVNIDRRAVRSERRRSRWEV